MTRSARTYVVACLGSAALHLAAAGLVVWPQPRGIHSARSSQPGAESVAAEAPPAPSVARTSGVEQILELATHVPAGAIAGLTNHLWQSTWFAAVAGLLVLAFRHARARVRHALWLAASLKFFVPFSLLIVAGRALGSLGTPKPPTPAAVSAIAPISGLFQVAPTMMAQAVPASAANFWIGIALAVWVLGFAVIGVSRLRSWRRVRQFRRRSRRFEGHASWPPGVIVRSAAGLLEPGVVGWWHPVILVPAGIDRALTRDQLRIVISHEACHIRRHDNFTSSLHMFVEAVYWFHPAVWWIGGRLVHERERACDQSVLRAGGDTRTYAEAIVAVCRLYVDSGLACVSGVSASSVKARVEAIMRNDVGQPVGKVARWIALTCGAVVLVVPIALGIVTAPAALEAQAQPAETEAAFSTVSIRPHAAADRRRTVNDDTPGRFEADNATIGTLIRIAYDLPAFRVAGAPAWLEDDGFDIVATTPLEAGVATKRSMLRRLLAERFGLGAHRERRDQEVYILAVADRNAADGRRLRPAAAGCPMNAPESAGPIGIAPAAGAPCGFLGFAAATDFASRSGGLTFRALSLDGLATKLSPIFGRQVVNRTGLPGRYDADFDFIAEIPVPPPPPGAPRQPARRAASAWTVFPEQLGLRFDGGRAPVDVLVIDRVERPKAN